MLYVDAESQSIKSTVWKRNKWKLIKKTENKKLNWKTDPPHCSIAAAAVCVSQTIIHLEKNQQQKSTKKKKKYNFNRSEIVYSASHNEVDIRIGRYTNQTTKRKEKKRKNLLTNMYVDIYYCPFIGDFSNGTCALCCGENDES